MQVLLLIVAVYLAVASRAEVYYITPGHDGSCDVNKVALSPCYTLQQLTEEEILKPSNDDSVELVFLSGTHSILSNHTLNVSNFNTTIFRPYSRLDESEEVFIHCEIDSQLPVVLHNITNVAVSALHFTSCSIEYSYEANSKIERTVTITECLFEKSQEALTILSTEPNLNIWISKCSFVSNDGAINMSKPYFIYNKIGRLEVTESSFDDNWCRFRRHALIIESTELIVNHSLFVNNQANYGGAILGYDESNLQISNSVFRNNYATGEGGVIFVRDSNLTIDTCQFTNNSAGANGGVFSLEGLSSSLKTSFTFINSTVQSNNASYYGGALYMILEYESVTIVDCHFEFNSASSGGVLYFEGGESKLKATDSTFLSNKAEKHGGAICCRNSKKVLLLGGWSMSNLAENGDGGFAYLSNCKISTQQWQYNISNNEAVNGGAVYAEEDSGIYIKNGAALMNNTASKNGGAMYLFNSDLSSDDAPISFESNSASEKGGAIFAQNERCEEVFHTTKCFLTDLSRNNEMKFLFSNNTAAQGPILYGGLLDRCCFDDFTGCDISGIDAIKPIFEYDPAPLAITSDPIKVCMCNADLKPDCATRELKLTKMRGQTVKLIGTVVDQNNNPKDSFIRARYNDSVGILGEGEAGATTGMACRNLTYHIFTVSEKATLYLQPEGSCERSNISRLTLSIEILPCSVGFEEQKDRCVCERRLSALFGNDIECDINANSIRTRDSVWLEYDDQQLKIHTNCPLDYCQENTNTIYLARPADEQCAYNRSGVLCGACRANYSIALGGSKCLQCSSSYPLIWLIPLFAVAGIALVALLLVLDVTVSHGTLNGLIFYANVLSIAGATNLQSCSISPVLSVFLAWLNLDFGVETCFYSGMDTYQKAWLQLVFPLYIWLLITCITIASHYSSTAMKAFSRRNIAILATLLLLSYAKVLKTIIMAFNFTSVLRGDAVNTSDPLVSYKVWTHDGNLEYLKGKHVYLFLASLMLLIVLFLPYTLLLTFGQCLRSLQTQRRFVRRCINSTAFISIMDAYHAPYNRRHRYWTGLMLLARIALFLAFTLKNSDNQLVANMYTTTIASIGLLALKICAMKMYRNFYVNLLELSFLFNLSILSATLYYLGTSESYYKGDVCRCIDASVSISLITFVGVLIYHAYLQLNKTKRFTSIKDSLLTKLQHSTADYREIEEVTEHQKLPTSSTVELREELLESENNGYYY